MFSDLHLNSGFLGSTICWPNIPELDTYCKCISDSLFCDLGFFCSEFRGKLFA